MDWKYHKAWRETCLLHILSRFCLSHELCWRLRARMIAIFIITYPITNTVFSFPNWFQLRAAWKHRLSNCNRVTVLQFQFTATNTMNLDGLSDKAEKIKKKKKRDRKKQRRGGGVHRIVTTNWRKEKRKILCKCAQQAPVHYHFMETDAWDTGQRPGPQTWISAASLESFVPSERPAYFIFTSLLNASFLT